MKVAILAIGTEITTGEILNSNAQWLSNELVNLGFEVDCHLVVPDDTQAILEALDFVGKRHSLVFTTGGLGPTTDDFTRDVISTWCGEKLVFDEKSWAKINDRLSSFGVVVSESNRQQCFFPKNAEIIDNPRGTANAFAVTCAATKLFCLPGPPREIESIWLSYLRDAVARLNPVSKKTQLLLWHCLGASESALGEIVEKALEGSGYLTGYRPHIPYVEVKVWLPADVDVQTCSYLKRLDEKISEWIIYRGEDDIAEQLVKALNRFSAIHIEDQLTIGNLANRLGPYLRTKPYSDLNSKLSINTGCVQPTVVEVKEALNITLSKFDIVRNSWTISVSKDGKEASVRSFQYPRKVTEQNLSRMYRHCCEASIAYCVSEL